ncbi:hypothetical protein [uncultured Agrococcus sp.]|uniref:hypothetical protein n=1 Tax=uncultured Agrococcus sp. TaxID=382258 RepID=UPI0025D6DE3B|nr:hypothetical protein [uncultured Agrococcus sp.]
MNHPSPQLGDVEREAAKGIPEVASALAVENLPKGSGDGTFRKGGFAHFLEEWLFPCVGLAALVFSALMVAPASWFGRTITYVYDSGADYDFETVNFTNVGSRLTIALLCAVIGIILVVTNIVVRSVQRHWRLASQAMAVMVTIGAIINAMFLAINIYDGFGELMIPMWAYLALVVGGLIMSILSFTGYRRGRIRAVESLFARLPQEQQRAILTDRARALDVLVQRDIARHQEADRVSKLPFGRYTGRVNAKREE